MDFFAHAVAERGIDELMPLDQALAFKCRRDDDGIEMLAIAIDVEMRAFETGSNIFFNEFRSWEHGDTFKIKTTSVVQLRDVN